MKKKFSRKFEQLIDFVNFTHEFREVVRIARSPNSKRYENDAEHSYQLAMVAWFLIEQDKLKLNKKKCLMYTLSHDLVEIYAGDTYIFDKKKVSTQRKREKEALRKIKKRFPSFKSLIKVIEGYEKRKDAESRFVYALDKIITPIQIYLEDGKLWHQHKISYDQVIKHKNTKILVSKNVNKYWQELLQEFTKNKKKLFYSK